MLFLLRYYNDEITINMKTLFINRWKTFWTIFHWKWFFQILCKMLQFIYFYLAPYGNSSKWYISIQLDKSNSPVLHNFMKCFSGTQINQKINVLRVNYLAFAICYFWLLKKWCWQKWMMLEIIYRIFLKLWHC